MPKHNPLPGKRLPSDTVVEQTTPSMQPDPGESEQYARADHCHGTPPAGGGGAGKARAQWGRWRG